MMLASDLLAYLPRRSKGERSTCLMDSTAQDLAGLGAASAHCAELSGGSIERRYCAAVANHAANGR